ncbi:hypothetical protein ASPZODRAFT_109016 [Penicilliopsis zonata CBS 506.65]|uniref:Glutaredoxin domain-containing protein n=1 Tax=Penicilliopsis zonata CBS 506.65 TaxID=1073090 RepID=A0A1L9SR06_9EURO|nr:hypothetical protein ASPZODRAFT_109016 [Penicilliopsis zonata CBS 506.65]OJJ49546.1 hypothetical protein ASPZODRAFT_109016 [Penicilliopsis zonata CBS 506.65]
MPSPRRIKVLLAAVCTLIFVYLYFSSDASGIQDQKFYRSTVEAMKVKEAEKHSALEKGDKTVFPKLQPAQQVQQPVDKEAVAANAQAMKNTVNTPSSSSKGASEQSEEMEEISIAGRTKMTVPKQKDTESKDVTKEQGAGDDAKKEEKKEQENDAYHQAKDELNTIFKRSPVIIFSKSYCPYSAKAKNILLQRYSIVPAPYVVELDLHPLGRELQAVLAEMTGRRTVPNVLVSGTSIGGGDDMVALDQSDKLASTFKSLGGNWIAEVKRKDPEPESKQD